LPTGLCWARLRRYGVGRVMVGRVHMIVTAHIAGMEKDVFGQSALQSTQKYVIWVES
jgi:hypothetical protein